MRRGLGIAVVLAGCLMAAALVRAQAPADENARQGAGQSKADPNAKKAAAPAAQAGQQAGPPGGANAFPEDTSNVPLMPSKLTPDIPAGDFNGPENAAPMPGDDLDPVRSPDEAPAESGSVQELESSSDVKSMDSLLPKPGEEEPGKKKGKKDAALDEGPKETSKEDITVGEYYLDIKNWKAAQSRFQSALVLAPEDPEVYWGLAESARHLGKYAEARANYQKVIDYDPGSKHAKEAEKALKDPQIQNAKAAQ